MCHPIAAGCERPRTKESRVRLFRCRRCSSNSDLCKADARHMLRDPPFALWVHFSGPLLRELPPQAYPRHFEPRLQPQSFLGIAQLARPRRRCAPQLRSGRYRSPRLAPSGRVGVLRVTTSCLIGDGPWRARIYDAGGYAGVRPCSAHVCQHLAKFGQHWPRFNHRGSTKRCSVNSRPSLAGVMQIWPHVVRIPASGTADGQPGRAQQVRVGGISRAHEQIAFRQLLG